jgi:hypothetical protein
MPRRDARKKREIELDFSPAVFGDRLVHWNVACRSTRAKRRITRVHSKPSHRAATTRGQTDGDESEVDGREESGEENRCEGRSSESDEVLEREHQEGAGEEAGRQGV